MLSTVMAYAFSHQGADFTVGTGIWFVLELNGSGLMPIVTARVLQSADFGPGDLAARAGTQRGGIHDPL
jgi:hypothetical protein